MSRNYRCCRAEVFSYRFKTEDAGNFWYHPHLSSAEQLGRGWSAVDYRGREPTGFAHERT